ncbi:MAG: hypothetical protein ACJAVV_003070 [Alphaproteobacteria bacterium]|jgi:hypothetical protein
MKTRLNLQQPLPYALMIGKALDFCEFMLTRSEILYPFALVTDNNNHSDVNCIFVPHKNQLAQPHMIESLQEQIETHKTLTADSASVLVYAAEITHPNATEPEALVFTITDSQGHNTVSIYPYKHVKGGIKISHPCTCNFSD